MSVRFVDRYPAWMGQVRVFPCQTPTWPVDVVQAPHPQVWGVGLDVALRQRLLERSDTQPALQVIRAIRAAWPAAGVLKKIGLLWQNHVHGDARLGRVIAQKPQRVPPLWGFVLCGVASYLF